MTGITSEQYEAVIKKYPILEPLYALLRDFRRIMFSQVVEDLNPWISNVASLKIEEIDTYETD